MRLSATAGRRSVCRLPSQIFVAILSWRSLLWPFAFVHAYAHAVVLHGASPTIQEGSFGTVKLVCPGCGRIFWRSAIPT